MNFFTEALSKLTISYRNHIHQLIVCATDILRIFLGGRPKKKFGWSTPRIFLNVHFVDDEDTYPEPSQNRPP